MQNVALIGIDLGKHSFHIHCQDKSGNALLRKKFTRTKLMQFLSTCPSSVVVMEACAGAHFMARRISCVFRSIRSRIGIEVRSAIRIHSINRELNFFYRF
ncbi:hypothetical protein NEO03_25600, partial [Escherichia coli]|nr:hypothetical protein [Escherichia coli]